MQIIKQFKRRNPTYTVIYSLINYKNSIESPKNDGFGSAYVTILDSNLTTLFAAIFLFAFGFGPIRGFSISLIIGIISSLIVTFIVLKFFIDITSGKYLGLNKW